MTDRIDDSRAKVRQFGLLFGALGFLAAAYAALAHHRVAWWWLGAGALFTIAGLAAYPLLRPVYRAWMKFAFALAWVNTRVLLGVFFYLVLTPVGLLMRLLGRDLIDQKIDRSAATYWKARKPAAFDPTRYERLF
ncbi:MAG TPA: SxtJ family membrane protein [Bacteroidota bacterium]|nr:SxtJ family membrane protein [Bacteroidota bacterium]